MKKILFGISMILAGLALVSRQSGGKPDPQAALPRPAPAPASLLPSPIIPAASGAATLPPAVPVPATEASAAISHPGKMSTTGAIIVGAPAAPR